MPHRELAPNVLSWASIIDDATADQAIALAKLPFVAPHVALMPDAHFGMGSAVGTVIPTDGAVLPASVGVDIGCFTGDTKVPLLDGHQKTLREMTEEGGTHWVYSLDSERKIVPGRAVGLKTREDAELMRVTVSGGEEIICTPDHEFMLNDGTYREARDLQFNDSLMPLYRKWQTRDGYESASTGKGSARQTHVMVYEALHGAVPDDHVVHHKNHIHFDNRPENLEIMEKGEHSRYHRRVGHSFDNTSPEFQELRMAGIRRRAEDPAKRERMVEVGTKNITAYMEGKPEHFKEAVADNGKRGAPYLTNFNTSPRACDECGEVSENPAALRWHKNREHGTNHKVIRIEHLDERADVYCLQVEEHNNFALAAGVFVHNCGMIAARTHYTAEDLNRIELTELRDQIERAIPLSPGNYNRRVHHDHTRQRVQELENLADRDGVDLSHSPKWREQLGSLGGGNHFIELCLDERDRVWCFLHSGSRGVGNKIARKHIGIARDRSGKGDIELTDPDHAYLREGTPEFDSYLKDLHWAQTFALLNREEMMDRFVGQLARLMGDDAAEIEVERVNTHHNYTEKINLYGSEVWLTRKGAIDATEGRPGLIPGSMGTRSYVTRGKGNEDALYSAPHGAGRTMSRRQAKKQFTAEDLDARMTGIVYRPGKEWVDEIPDAYKPIDQVMEDASDLVEVVHELRQVLNIKGT
ncbi:RtcB family protein [Corynebacterium halotolerans]|uniref:3'-phosphate/5'-hydroxy nucleic acid ligase n=1 Tax=Corynebacterium halotolerans YIM 70093 = DSM 44683 TaxID=1121362 RepID=M1MZU7_9CORY|nr:RtcB family protein [Corynebacterium halotolerans]AGF73244.1 hypothetical protein A605_11220 [Corynebacterium halotolerans YIM 70093 = DSM 44683]